MMYVPLLQTLEALLKNKAVISEVSFQATFSYVYSCMHRLNMGIKLPPVASMITVMEKVSQHTHCFQFTRMLYKYSYTMTRLRSVIPWALRPRFIN